MVAFRLFRLAGKLLAARGCLARFLSEAERSNFRLLGCLSKSLHIASQAKGLCVKVLMKLLASSDAPENIKCVPLAVIVVQPAFA